MKVREVMTPVPFVIDSTKSLEEALEQMNIRGCRHMPVVEEGNLVGVLTKREAQISMALCEASNVCPSVGAVCIKEIYFIDESDDVSQAVLGMADKKVECALVGDSNDNLVGIFTNTDAYRLLGMLLEPKGSRHDRPSC